MTSRLPLRDTLAFIRRSLLDSAVIYVSRLDLHERPVALLLVVPQAGERYDHRNPVQIVCNHRAISRRVRPAEERIEYAPSSSAVDFGAAAVDVPDALPDVVGTRAGAGFCCVAAGDAAPLVVLEDPDGSREES